MKVDAKTAELGNQFMFWLLMAIPLLGVGFFLAAGLRAVGDGIECYRYVNASGQPAAGIRREDQTSGARTLYLGFGLEAVSGQGPHGTQITPMTEALSAMLLYLAGLGLVEPASPIPAEFALGAGYPNPFNARVSVPIDLPHAGQVRISVFDSGGRVVTRERIALDEGASVLTLSAAAWPAGTYLIQIGTEFGAGRIKLALVK
jgi:hypothetical protein